jgi:hypothetical protein
VHALELPAARGPRRDAGRARDGACVEIVVDRLQARGVLGMSGPRIVLQEALVAQDERRPAQAS